LAVYTSVALPDLKRFVAGFDIGEVVAFEGIAQGVENSNFRLRTTDGNYVLTLYERLVNPSDLPFFLGLMQHLAGSGIPCPAPVADRNGQLLHELSGRPAAIVNFAPGDWPRDITPTHCRAVGTALGKLHVAAAGFSMTRQNDQSLPSWRAMFNDLASRADDLRPGFATWIEAELSALEAGWSADLPTGIIHGDLFPDNVFFEGGAITGVIDYYFACNDALAFDLAICLNAWCFENGTLDQQRARALCAGYEFIRPLESSEWNVFPLLARGAAMRFLVTRLHDWFHTPEDALAQRKDPIDFVPVIECHRAVSDSTAYGVG